MTEMSREQVAMVEELRERSKNDRAIIVGSEVRVLCDLALSALRSAEVVEDDGRLWSMLRNVLEQGAAINMDYAGGKYRSYEEYAARIDVAAHERVGLFRLSARSVSAGVKDHG